MEKIRPTLRVATLTREQFRRRMVGDKPSWIDLVDSFTPLALDQVIFTDQYSLRCPADAPRLSRRWVARGIPRNIQDRRQLCSRLSPITYHAFDNRFGRFDE